jgi:hypothetical protein
MIFPLSATKRLPLVVVILYTIEVSITGFNYWVMSSPFSTKKECGITKYDAVRDLACWAPIYNSLV